MEYLSVQEAADQKNCTVQAIRDAIRAGYLDAMQIGRPYIVKVNKSFNCYISDADRDSCDILSLRRYIAQSISSSFCRGTMANTVFYSWQSDLPTRENKDLIRNALQSAIEEVADDMEIGDAIRLDQDTKGVSGNPVIIDTILTKIRECRIFAPDVSYVALTKNGKKVPNPNVIDWSQL